ncbi:MAG TPA: RNA polymerase sigma factor [Candidatus Binatia bacterium]|nr:RNA polymerase sigma factor [Candidatus Binatia bacterium]
MDQLVDDFAARRPSGLEQVYALWSRLFFSVARHVIADSGQAEDCVHDALMRVWRNPNRFEGNREMLKAYLITCVRNESLGMVRREGRRDARELKAARLAPVTSVDPPVVDPVETQRLQAALGRLPEEQRRALTLAYYGNKTHVEIAQELSVPLGTIKSRISMAMRKLHTELASSGGTRS